MWNRALWGIKFVGSKKESMLLGKAWETLAPAHYEGEPTRALLFMTREQARQWCREKRQQYKGREDCCKHWRFIPVKVIEKVIEVE